MPFNDPAIDQILESLITLAKVKQNDKLSIVLTDCTLQVVRDTPINRFWRFLQWGQDGRDPTIAKINQIMEAFYAHIDKLCDEISRPVTVVKALNNKKKLRQYIVLIQNATGGINNLIETYHDDDHTASKLELIKTKMTTMIEEIQTVTKNVGDTSSQTFPTFEEECEAD